MKKKNIPVKYDDIEPEVISFRLDYEDLPLEISTTDSK
jgi:hypothetical protein